MKRGKILILVLIGPLIANSVYTFVLRQDVQSNKEILEELSYRSITAEDLYQSIYFDKATEEGIPADHYFLSDFNLQQDMKIKLVGTTLDSYVISLEENGGTREIVGTEKGEKEYFDPESKWGSVEACIRLYFAIRSPFIVNTNKGHAEFSKGFIMACKFVSREQALEVREYLREKVGGDSLYFRVIGDAKGEIAALWTIYEEDSSEFTIVVDLHEVLGMRLIEK
ncbi:MAG: hypothetical protein COT36_03860 [Parcubacteria group bacterium CG08_land_8_20_14_0_20_38_56]|nr:MAG: hypothetical protein COT36_03860 [Parcubacteria group bacterium CG08_land_8_20_14_0_20_38_56]